MEDALYEPSNKVTGEDGKLPKGERAAGREAGILAQIPCRPRGGFRANYVFDSSSGKATVKKGLRLRVALPQAPDRLPVNEMPPLRLELADNHKRRRLSGNRRHLSLHRRFPLDYRRRLQRRLPDEPRQAQPEPGSRAGDLAALRIRQPDSNH